MGRMEGGWRVDGGMEGGWEDGGWMEGGWKVDGGRMGGGWRVDGGWMEGGWRVDGGWMEGGWRVDGGDAQEEKKQGTSYLPHGAHGSFNDGPLGDLDFFGEAKHGDRDGTVEMEGALIFWTDVVIWSGVKKNSESLVSLSEKKNSNTPENYWEREKQFWGARSEKKKPLEGKTSTKSLMVRTATLKLFWVTPSSCSGRSSG
jgi:hypothetical protein